MPIRHEGAVKLICERRQVPRSARALCASLLALAWLIALGQNPKLGLSAAERPVPAAQVAAKPSATDPPRLTTDADVIAAINTEIRKAWDDAKVSPSAPATDSEWCRRVYLDVLGRIPSVEEMTRFVGEGASDKKARLVDRLLTTDEHVEEYARNWSNLWTTLLIGRPKPDADQEMVNREGMQQYLRRSFLRNRPYDEMVAEFISAKGSNTPGDEDYNGAVNFLLDNLQDNAATATAKTMRLFMGVQVQCTQCHNHPFNDKWKQDQFWGVNAFFRQAKALRTMRGRDVASVRLDDEDFAGESRQNPQEAEIYYELRNGTLAASLPTFLDGTRINPSGYAEEVNRRRELARLVTKNDYFGQAIVNRMWAHFLGHGFTKPVDDLGPHNPPTHPELLKRLGREVAAHGYDLKRLMRWIVLSEPYALSSKPGKRNVQDDPTRGVNPLFSRFYLRQMRAEELYESLLVATEAHKTKGSFEEQEKTKSQWLSQFTLAFGTDEGDDSTTFNGTIPQALMMMNGELVKTATSAETGGFLHRVASGKLDATAKIDYLYMAALARKPSKEELRLANAVLSARGGDTTAALQDVWWAVLNSNEFILNH